MTQPTIEEWLEALQDAKRHWQEDNLPLTSQEVKQGKAKIGACYCTCCKLSRSQMAGVLRCEVCPLPRCSSCPSPWIEIHGLKKKIEFRENLDFDEATLMWRGLCQEMVDTIDKAIKRLKEKQTEEEAK